MMAIPAVLMACMPTYETIGIIACFAVVFLRFLQGISFGGEFPTIMVTLYELAPHNRKGFFGSLTAEFAIIGYLIGLLVMIILKSVLGDEQMYAWGWRLMFGLSIIFIALVGYIRLNLLETLPKVDKGSTPIFLAVKENWRSMIKIFLYMAGPLCLLFNFIFYTYLLIQKTAQFSHVQIFILQALIVVYLLILFPIMGYLSDRCNRFKLNKWAFALLIIFCIPLYQLLLSGNIYLIILSSLVIGAFVSFIVGTCLTVIIDQSAEDCRVTMVGIPHSCAAIVASFTPAINEFLIYTLNINIAPAIYIIFCSFISLVVLFTMKSRQIY